MPPKQNPDANSGSYDFILKDDQKSPQPKRPRSLMPNLPKPVLIGIGAVAGLFVVIAVFVLLSSSGSGNVQKYLDVMARAQEISRVSALSGLKFQDVETANLAATTGAAMTSEQIQLTNYLHSTKTKFDAKKLAFYFNKSTEAQLQNAAQNNSLDETYVRYLKGQLIAYLQSLNSASKVAGKNGKPILAAAMTSTQTLLTAPQVAASQ